MWLVRRSALMVIIRTIRMVARPTATTVRVGSRTGSLLEQVPGMAGDTHLTDATVVALIATSIGTLTADLRDGGLKDVALVDMALRGAVWHFGAALKDAAPPEASVVDSMEGLGGTAKN